VSARKKAAPEKGPEPADLQKAIFQLKITLRGARPPIWRRVRVPATFSLESLHHVIQAAMGWEDYHLHQFLVGGAYYSGLAPDGSDVGWDEDMGDERGRTVDLHVLRHTFGTHLSKNGVAPRTAQAAMRHWSLDLTMNVYADPTLLDVADALRSRPSLSLTDEVQVGAEQAAH